MNERRWENRKTASWKTVIYPVLLLILSGILEGIIGSWLILPLMALIAAVGIAALLVYLRKKKGQKWQASVETAQTYTARQGESQAKKYDPRAIMDRDSRRRLEQLDSFLANGLIDKKEYAMLKAKYEKAMER